MPKRKNKGLKMVPSDYDDPDKSDSDNRGDPNFSQEDEDVAQLFPSPRVHLTRSRNIQNLGSTPETTQRGKSAEAIPAASSSRPALELSQQSSSSRKDQREITKKSRDASFEKAQRILQDARNRITNPTEEEEADAEIAEFRAWARKRRFRRSIERRKPSVMWNHVIKDPKEDRTQCMHCEKVWYRLRGSTSNALNHLKTWHYDRFTEEEILEMSKDGDTSGQDGSRPKRALIKKQTARTSLPRNSKEVKRVDGKLARVLTSNLSSWYLLDSADFGDFCDEILRGRYKVPGRTYMLTNVIHPMFLETKKIIKANMKQCKYIGLTTDAWTSLVQQSYITVTAHMLTDEFNLQSYVLDTSEIKERHTSDNLLLHLHKVLEDYAFETGNEQRITYNFNSTNPNDIFEEDMECEGEVNFLHTETDMTEITIDEEDIEADLMQLDESSNHSVQSTHSVSSGSNNVFPNVTITSDNASDITKAIRIGQFIWFGCAGHHLNLIAQAGFKQVMPAASLVKKCKKIVEHIKSSTPSSYLLVSLQEELELPLLRVLQENNTRWWSILLMMQSILDNRIPISYLLGNQQKTHLILSGSDEDNMEAIIELLKPFKDCGEKLSSETNVTISLVIPLFQKLKQHLQNTDQDCSLVTDMKAKMLAKLRTRYSSEQMQRLKTCTILDVRSKGILKVANHYGQFEKDVADVVLASQQQIAATERQERANLSASAVNQRSNTSIFAFEDEDIMADNIPSIETDNIHAEIRQYRAVAMSGEFKEHCNVVKWWQKNKAKYPCLFKAAQAYLHIPATSVPSERIFSLAGYMVRSRRSKILPRNVNQFIFLKKNRKYIPKNTSIWASS